jgi:hypothetical protein
MDRYVGGSGRVRVRVSLKFIYLSADLSIYLSIYLFAYLLRKVNR